VKTDIGTTVSRITPFSQAAVARCCDRTAYAYLPASVARFPDPEGLAALLADAGFEDVRYFPLTGGIAYLHCGARP